VDEPSDGREPSLAERYLEAHACGDLDGARWLGRQLERRLSARPPKEEDPFAHITPPRSPGTRRRKAHAGRRSVGHR
jgi:hypothetical protein